MDERLKYLKLRAKLNDDYDKALELDEHNRDFDIKELPPKERTVDEVLSDVNTQKMELLEKLKKIMRGSEAQEFLLGLEDNEVKLLNRHWIGYLADAKNIENLDHMYARKLYDNYVKKLMKKEGLIQDDDELETLADTVLDFARTKGIDEKSLYPLVDTFVKDNDYNSLQKLYKDLLLTRKESPRAQASIKPASDYIVHPDEESSLKLEEIAKPAETEYSETNMRKAENKLEKVQIELTKIKQGIQPLTKQGKVSKAAVGSSAWATAESSYREKLFEAVENILEIDKEFEFSNDIIEFLQEAAKSTKPKGESYKIPENVEKLLLKLPTPSIPPPTPPTESESSTPIERPDNIVHEKDDFKMETKEDLVPYIRTPTPLETAVAIQTDLIPFNLYLINTAPKKLLGDKIRDIVKHRNNVVEAFPKPSSFTEKTPYLEILGGLESDAVIRKIFPNANRIEVSGKNVRWTDAAGKHKFNLDNLPSLKEQQSFMAYLMGSRNIVSIPEAIKAIRNSEEYKDIDRRIKKHIEGYLDNIESDKREDEKEIEDKRKLDKEEAEAENLIAAEKNKIKALIDESDAALNELYKLQAEERAYDAKEREIYDKVYLKKIKRFDLDLDSTEEKQLVEVLQNKDLQGYLDIDLQNYKDDLDIREASSTTRVKNNTYAVRDLTKELDRLERKTKKSKTDIDNIGRKKDLLQKYLTNLKYFEEEASRVKYEKNRLKHNMKELEKLEKAISDREDRSIDDFEVVNRARIERIKDREKDAIHTYNAIKNELERYGVDIADIDLSKKVGKPRSKKRPAHMSKQQRKSDKKANRLKQEFAEEEESKKKSSKKKSSEKGKVLRSGKKIPPLVRKSARDFDEEIEAARAAEKEAIREETMAEREQAAFDADMKAAIAESAAEAEDKADDDAKAASYGRGIGKPQKIKQKYTPFGKLYLNLHNLENGIFDLQLKSQKTTKKIPKAPVSTTFLKLIHILLETGDFNQKLFNLLSDTEKKYFNQAISASRLEIGLPELIDIGGGLTERDNKVARYNILLGELNAGNNSSKILKEIKGILTWFLRNKMIDHVYFNSLLADIAMCES